MWVQKARDISRDMISHVEDENPSDVVFVAGGNDLPTDEIASPQFISKVADSIVKVVLSKVGTMRTMECLTYSYQVSYHVLAPISN